MDMQVELAERDMTRIAASAERSGRAYADLFDEFEQAFRAGELTFSLPTPASRYGSHMSLIEWIEDDMAGAESTTLRAMLHLIGDAAQGKPVAAAAAVLIHSLAHKYAAAQIDGSDWGAA